MSLTEKMRIVVRLSAVVLAFLLLLPPYYLWKPLARRNPWPRRFLRLATRCSGIKVSLHGRRASRDACFLANHISWIDIPAIAGATGTAFVAHDGLTSIAFLRWLCALNDTVFIARHRRNDVAEQVAQIRKAISDTGSLTIFPEGTTGDSPALLPFKSSLLSALDPLPQGLAIQPVWLDYGKQVSDIAWVGDEPGMENFFRILARKEPARITLHFLEPLDGESLRGRKAIAAAAQAKIAQAIANKTG